MSNLTQGVKPNKSLMVIDDIFNYHSCIKTSNGDLIITLKKSFGSAKRRFLLSNAYGVWERPYFRVNAIDLVDPSKTFVFKAVRYVPDNIWHQLISNAFNKTFSNSSL